MGFFDCTNMVCYIYCHVLYTVVFSLYFWCWCRWNKGTGRRVVSVGAINSSAQLGLSQQQHHFTFGFDEDDEKAKIVKFTQPDSYFDQRIIFGEICLWPTQPILWAGSIEIASPSQLTQKSGNPCLRLTHSWDIKVKYLWRGHWVNCWGDKRTDNWKKFTSLNAFCKLCSLLRRMHLTQNWNRSENTLGGGCKFKIVGQMQGLCESKQCMLIGKHCMLIGLWNVSEMLWI